MDTDGYIDQLAGSADARTKMEAARVLTPFTDDSRVMDALCEAAVGSSGFRLREILIDALRSNPAGDCLRFSDIALWSRDPTRR